ncbi:MAG: hypothetical protein WB441_07330 [Nocardioidaceae bacterium]
MGLWTLLVTVGAEPPPHGGPTLPTYWIIPGLVVVLTVVFLLRRPGGRD